MEHVHAWKCAGALPVDGDRHAGMPDCEAPLLLVCGDRLGGDGGGAERAGSAAVPGGCGQERAARCGTSRRSKCEPCAARYRGRVGRVAGSGLVVGKRGVFLTLTAPGAYVHHKRDGSVCRCTPPGGVDLETWNVGAAARWNRFVQELSRRCGADRVWTDDRGRRRREQGLVYFRAAEVQRRGALHYHVLLRRRDGRPLALRGAMVRRLAVKHGFGHSVDVQKLQAGHASYVAKYVAKSSDERQDVPWRREVVLPSRVVHVVDRATGEITGEHVRPEVREIRRHASFRTWSASRAWGDSMGVVKAAQQHHVMVLEQLPDWRCPGAVRRSWGLVSGVPFRPDYAPPLGGDGPD